MKVQVRNIHERWAPGEQAFYDYSLEPDATSAISQRLAHRTGQTVTVLEEVDPDDNRTAFPTFEERGDAGAVVCYIVKFPDGHEDTAFEDELLDLAAPYLIEERAL